MGFGMKNGEKYIFRTETREMIVPPSVLKVLADLSQSSNLEFCLILKNKDDESNTCKFQMSVCFSIQIFHVQVCLIVQT